MNPKLRISYGIPETCPGKLVRKSSDTVAARCGLRVFPLRKVHVAVALEKALWDRGIVSYILDGDNVRHGLNKDLGFSRKIGQRISEGLARWPTCLRIRA